MVENWKQALRRLTSQFSGAGAGAAIMTAAQGSDSDRAAALIMASFVDIAMNGLIIYAIRVSDQTAVNQLFMSDQSPLYDFGAKITFCKAVHIIGNDTAYNLDIIRKIRNTFAHALDDINFKTKEISKACSLLILDKEHTRLSNRLKFGIACDVIYQRVLHLLFSRQLSGSLAEKSIRSPITAVIIALTA